MSTEVGNVGELVAQTAFAKKGFEIYPGGVGNTYYDFIAIKARIKGAPIVNKVEVKTSRVRNKNDSGWIFNIRKSYGDKHFDNKKVDYLCCYIEPLDRMFIIKASQVTQKREFLVTDEHLGDL